MGKSILKEWVPVSTTPGRSCGWKPETSLTESEAYEYDRRWKADNPHFLTWTEVADIIREPLPYNSRSTWYRCTN